jgi:hypothetical protein
MIKEIIIEEDSGLEIIIEDDDFDQIDETDEVVYSNDFTNDILFSNIRNIRDILETDSTRFKDDYSRLDGKMNILSSILEKAVKSSDMIGLREDYTKLIDDIKTDDKDFIRFLDIHLGYILEENEKNKERIEQLESKIENLLMESGKK